MINSLFHASDSLGLLVCRICFGKTLRQVTAGFLGSTVWGNDQENAETVTRKGIAASAYLNKPRAGVLALSVVTLIILVLPSLIALAVDPQKGLTSISKEPLEAVRASLQP